MVVMTLHILRQRELNGTLLPFTSKGEIRTMGNAPDQGHHGAFRSGAAAAGEDQLMPETAYGEQLELRGADLAGPPSA
jgi:hypothetical protein